MTDILFSVGDFDYIVITSAREGEAISVAANSICQYGPIDSYLRYSNVMLEEYLRNILDNYLGREVSVICIHRPTQEVCGGCFSNGINPEAPDVFSEPNMSTMKIVNDFLEEIDQNFFENSGSNPRQCLHQHILGVDIKWAGNKIGEKLVLASIQVAKAKDLTYALIELAGPGSKHICLNIHKYTPYQEVIYRDYEHNGVKYLENLEGSCVLAIKEFS